MITFDNPIKCNEYIPEDIEKIMLWMSNSYIYYETCETCKNCGRCKEIKATETCES